MSNEWGQLLEKHGISHASEGDAASVEVADTIDSGPQLVDLTHFAVVEITGEDAAAFLQGQFCNDTAVVAATQAQITGYCTPKGRLLVLPTIVGTPDGFRMVVLHSLKESFLKRLRMFVMRSKVVITEKDDWLCSGVIAGEDGSLGEAGDWLGGLPAGVLNAATSATRQVIRWHDCVPTGEQSAPRARYLVMASTEDQLALWNNCATLSKHSHWQWRLGDITAGVPTISPGVSEAFVPQMLNMQLINALSFTKGCYPGQEIVARMQYLGKLKRHMRLFSMPVSGDANASTPIPGDTLSSDADKDAGVVVDAVRDSTGQSVLLAVMKVSSNAATVMAGEVALTSLELPYQLPSLAPPTEAE